MVLRKFEKFLHRLYTEFLTLVDQREGSIKCGLQRYGCQQPEFDFLLQGGNRLDCHTEARTNRRLYRFSERGAGQRVFRCLR